MMSSEKLGYYAQLIRLDRPIGIYLLLWPTLWGLWLAAEGVPDTSLLVIFVLGVVFMRSAGCAINDYADRDIDLHVERTKTRPLAAGKITAKEALWVFIALCLASFILVLQLNLNTILMSLVAVVLVATYPFMKRFHHLPQVHLGAAFAWAIPMAFVAIHNETPPLQAWLAYIATLLWTTAYDTMYAMSDREDDLKIGVKSSAILFGSADRIVVGALQLLTLVLLLGVGVIAKLGGWYFLGVLLATVLAFYQQWLISERERLRCFKAFLNNNYFGMIVFVGLALDYALK